MTAAMQKHLSVYDVKTNILELNKSIMDLIIVDMVSVHNPGRSSILATEFF